MASLSIETLPAEIILQIVSFLEPGDIVRCQSVSRRFWKLTHDNKLWKTICFENSRAEALRRRQQLMASQDEGIVALRQAMTSLPGDNGLVHNENAPNAEMSAHGIAARERIRALANWDPSYPGEKIDFYQEYIHRHAPITMNWLQTATDGAGGGNEPNEATGIGVLRDDGEFGAERAVAPLDDGSICIWDITPWSGRGPKSQGRVIGRTAPGLLTALPSSLDRDVARERSKAMMTETGAVECVSIDSVQRKGFFAVRNTLNEVDLNTMKLVSQNHFSFPITALSEAVPTVPLTVGTNMTLHLHDPRQPHPSSSPPSATTFSPGLSTRCELIAGTSPPRLSPRLNLGSGSSSPLALPISAITGTHQPPAPHATLSQPGPLSILHLPEDRAWDGNGAIWVAGRFTSLLNYDRRFFPRLRGTVHSGARLASLTALPVPFLPRQSALMRQASTTTSSIPRPTTSSNSASIGLSPAEIHAAKSLPGHTLVAGGSYNGKGSLELYGVSPEPAHATLSTNDARHVARTSYRNRQTVSRSGVLAVAAQGARLVYSDGDGGVAWVERDGRGEVRRWGLDEAAGGGGNVGAGVARGGAEHGGAGVEGMEGVEEPPRNDDDVVQKLVPTGTADGAGANDANLLCWTGEGRLGLLGFGRRPLFSEEEWREGEGVDEETRQEEERAREYAGRMRRALERQADEVRWVRGMGLPGLG
ncbi:MAG: hypothetical protein M1821_007595 [Bathelium mastoideum]|nr:MAG: hypothetical protein M1821_007595 [Bathelium mastoideum]